MVFIETELKGAYVIEPTFLEDERGFFARTFCEKEFRLRGLNFCVKQCSISSNNKAGTLRGMHFQSAPHQEVKLVRCTKGGIYDVILDLRPTSATFMQWTAVELAHDNGRMLYIAEGLAHGFQTLYDDSEVFYQISEYYHPECARGVRWNDPAFRIKWPLGNPIVSNKDSEYPDFVLARCT
jgi:dTDP-4-dehydrorhamnose 3,5-epimerase